MVPNGPVCLGGVFSEPLLAWEADPFPVCISRKSDKRELLAGRLDVLSHSPCDGLEAHVALSFLTRLETRSAAPQSRRVSNTSSTDRHTT